MRENWKEAAFGVFFWIAMALILIRTVVLPADSSRATRVFIPLVLQNAQGVRDGTRVSVRGVDWGTVVHLRYFAISREGDLLPQAARAAAGQVVLAIVRLNSAIDIYPNYRVRTLNAGVISGKHIDIDPGSGSAASILAPRIMATRDVSRLIKTGELHLSRSEALEAGNFDDPMTVVADVLYENRDGVRQIIRNSRQITDRLNRGNGTVAALLNDDRLHRGLNEILGDSKDLTRDGGALLESFRETRAFLDLISVVPSILLSLPSP